MSLARLLSLIAFMNFLTTAFWFLLDTLEVAYEAGTELCTLLIMAKGTTSSSTPSANLLGAVQLPLFPPPFIRLAFSLALKLYSGASSSEAYHITNKQNVLPKT
jgi:mannose/fructose/N-acetylgalactosamine-specific phosphotransferase system component IID